MSCKRTASVTEIRRNFPRILAQLYAGEAVTITLRHRVVAELVPIRRLRKFKKRFPDLTRRLERQFGKKPLADLLIQTIMEQNRSAL